jgi:outer membrane protein OmpA-like peptidoglycan-associated protein
MALTRWIPVRSLAAALACLALAVAATAQESPFARGWDLDPAASNIRFQSVKNQTKVESSAFAKFTGGIEPDGVASVRVLLDSVDTGVDLRNVRMRFLFFETFRFPEATISVRLTPEMVADLATVRRKTLTLPYAFDIHGVRRQLEAEMVVTLLNDDRVSVASGAPVSIAIADFGLAENIKKLEEAAGGISIIPSATVSFDFVFARRPIEGAVVAAAEAPAAPVPAVTTPVALEAAGDLSSEACRARFETLSQTGDIQFRIASARLIPESMPVLAGVVDIVRRCPGMTIEVAGHTDSDGSAATNLALSDARARTVADYLVANGVEPWRIRAVGYGADRPVVPNDSASNKRRNRRIEFAVTNG